jgi:hypothetical protein
MTAILRQKIPSFSRLGGSPSSSLPPGAIDLLLLRLFVLRLEAREHTWHSTVWFQGATVV